VYLKNDCAFLEMGLVQWALCRARKAGWSVHLTPELVRDRIISGCGFRPRDKVGAGSAIYSVAGEDVSLVGTAEIALAGVHADKLLTPGNPEFPIKMCGFSHAYRRETGQGGRGSRGLYRLHQFSKGKMDD
jgi:seryl-tRNA synthetase